MPKGPFGTKNAIALKIVVKYYRGSIYYDFRFAIVLPQEKKKHPTYYRGSELLSR